MGAQRKVWVEPRNKEGWKKVYRRINATLDRQVVVEFALLEAEFIRSQGRFSHSNDDEIMRWLETRETVDEKKKRALEAIRQRGDIGPMQEFVCSIGHPEIAPFIKRPKRAGKGDHFKKEEPKPTDNVGIRLRAADHNVNQWDGGLKDIDPRLRLAAAVADVRRIRELRQQFLDGKRNGKIGGMCPEEIAADRWWLSPGEVRRSRLSRATLRTSRQK